MKIFELFTSALEESGIKTAKLDIAAHKALMEEFPKVIKDIILKAEDEIPPKKIDPDDEFGGYDRSAHYDNLYDLFHKEKNKLVVPICMEAGKVLGKITRSHLYDIKDTLRPPHQSRQLDWRINDVKVKVEAREMSTDDYKDYGGYYSHGENLLKIFVNREEVHYAAMELVTEEIVGESERRGLYDLTNTVVPVFVHEYAHLEQAFRTLNPTKDFGYITVDVKGRRGKGKRGGYLRSPRDSTKSYLAYKGNVDEIDSFAAQAVAQLMHDFHSKPKWSSTDINSVIKDTRENLSYGYSSGSKTYDHYLELLKDTFDGRYADIGLKPKEMEKVWKRFAKRVYQKLGDYLIPNIGKGKETSLSNINPEWLQLAKTKPIGEVVMTIAKDQVNKIIKDSERYFYVDPKKRVENIKQGLYGTDKGEQFLDLYYFGDNWSDTPNQQRVHQAYRNLVARLYVNYLNQQTP